MSVCPVPMNRFLAAAGAVFLLAAPASAQTAQVAQPAKPKLLVVISVDQLSTDLFAEYRPHFTGGLKRLSEGVVFPAGYQGHAATETCPGHSTILTGSRPSRTGVIANNWFDLSLTREDKRVYCSEDPRVPGSSSKDYTVSTHFLKVPALGDLMKRVDPRSRIAVVAGKDRAAIMMGGYAPDQRFWWRGQAFVAGTPKPVAALAAANQAVAAALAQPRQPLTLPPVCEARVRAVPVGDKGFTVGAGRFARGAGNRDAFRASPELDGATLALAAAMRAEMRLGEGAATDLLILGLSATDYVGHSFGTSGSEMCLQIHALDRELGDFFGRLDQAKLDYLVVLTADHGGHDLPERIRQQGLLEAARAEKEIVAGAPGDRELGEMNKRLKARFGLTRPPLYSDAPFGDFYVDRSLPAAQRARVLREAISEYRRHTQVAEVFTHEQLRAAPAPAGPPDTWSLLDRARASFDPQRSGDFIVLLKPRVTPIPNGDAGYVATHGSPWDYDRRVPILFWRKGLRPFEQPLAVETVDIMPSLAALIGVPVAPGSIDGRCLDILEGPETSCR
jgi:predicted AlkP superfamily pyrophosphatase or phosphodiesterase